MTDIDMEGAEFLSTKDEDLVPQELDSSQNPLAVNITNQQGDAVMENVQVAAQDGTSLEEDQIEYLNRVILNNLPTAKEPGIRTWISTIKLLVRIEDLLFEPMDHPVDEPEELIDLTQQGRIDRYYGEVLKHPWFIGRRLKSEIKNNSLEIMKRTIKDRKDVEELESMSKKVMDTFSDVLQDYAKGRLDYHFSSRHDGKRPHADVHHPDADRVHLLLAGLGDPNETLTSWEDAFHRCNEENMRYSISTMVIDLPGYGKTRLLFEAVTKYFLVYFTCSKEKATWATRSGDAQWVVESVNATSKGCTFSPTSWTWYHHTTWPPLDARRRLLLLQACPPSLADSEDLFVHITKVAQSFNDETLRRAAGESLDRFYDTIRKVVHGTNDSPRIHVTFDDVHIATRDPWLSHRRSLLEQMLEMVEFSLQLRAIVCAASQVSLNMLNIDALCPGSYLSYMPNTRCLQSNNLEKYVLHHLKVAPSRLERIKMWLFPRPRLIARMIEMYLAATQSGVKEIPYHRILSSAIEVSTGYRPMDAMDLEAQEEKIPEFILGQSFGCGALEHKSFNDPTYTMMVSMLLYRWMLSNPSTLKLERNESAKLIELGVFPLPSLDPRSPTHFTWNVCDDVALTEAYGATSLMALLGFPGANIFKYCMKKAIVFDEAILTQNDIFERTMVWTIMDNLGKENGCVPENIFHFHDDAPPWTKQPYRLISFAKEQNVPVPVTWMSGASPRLGFRARRPDDIEHWLKDPKGVPFIFKDDHHCLVFVENRMTLERSVMVVHGTLEGDCEIEQQLTGITELCKKVDTNFTIKTFCEIVVGLAWFMGSWLICKVVAKLLGPGPAPGGQSSTNKFSQNVVVQKGSANLFGRCRQDSVQHRRVVYNGINGLKDIEKGHLGLFVLS
ncbi:hypothetical protein DFS33DRAFT_1415441 [Desarmillaria ectypa]|nr:hypothetical protein DFS33DRAFT_1415441 [Desarmillaria ectypa]